MKLYFSPAACSLAPHIALREAGLPLTLLKVDLHTHKLEDGTDYFSINPKGSVPLLELDSGERISEVSAILQYIADHASQANLAPANGTLARTRLQEALNFIATEIHKGSGLLFNPQVDDATKGLFRKRLRGLYEHVNQQLSASGWMVGDHFTVADVYLFVMVNGANFLKLDLHGLDAIGAFMGRMQARASVQSAFKAEGLAN